MWIKKGNDMYFTEEKLEHRIRLLEEMRYIDMEELFPFAVSEDIRGSEEIVKWPPVKGDTFTGEKHCFLNGRNRYYWAEKRVNIRRAPKGFRTVILFDMGKTGAGTNSGFESLLYVDGEQYQAVDSNHKEVFFESEYQEKEVELSLMLWSGLEGGGAHQEQIIHMQQACMGFLHTLSDEFYFLGKAIFKTLKMLREGDEIREPLMAALDEAVMSLDYSESREVFYGQVSQAYLFLLEKLKKMKKSSDVTVHCVGHTHIDVAWLWQLKHTQEKALRSFSTVLRYMEQYEDYRFVQSQPQLYDYVKHNQPDFYEKMKQRVMEGRFEADGAMWVEADCNLTSGESLVRQIMEGNSFFETEFGKRSTCLWLPDVFGYSVALPQILKLCNISRFVTTKISWNEYNKMPHDTFYWKGMDGSKVLAYFITTPEEGWPEGHKYSTYNGQISPRTVIGTWRKYEDKEINKDLLITYGYGDGGGGPTRTMLMMRKAMDQIPGIPNVKQTSVKEFLDVVEKNLNETKCHVPEWCGELYLENHRGTYTSQAANKRCNRKMEFLLTEIEMKNTFSFLESKDYQGERIRKLWRTLLLNQFHDIIPGSSIHEVYQDSQKQYEWMEREGAELQHEILRPFFAEEEGVYHVFNPLAYERKEVLFFPIEKNGSFFNEEGRRLQQQRSENGIFVLVECIALGFTQIFFQEEEEYPQESAFHYEANTLHTPYYCISWNEEGVISSIYDKENEREVLRLFGNRLTVYEDLPYNNDAWNIDLFHTDKYETVGRPEQIMVEENGSLRFKLRFEYCYRNSHITQNVICYAKDRRIDFETEIDWHEKHRLLKTCFDVDVDALSARYDVQFGNVERPTHYNTSWDYAKFEVAAQKWADLSETGYGAALINDCKYGYSIHNSQMNLSLIKCATFPDIKADQGKHSFIYAFLPHAGSFQEAGVHISAERMNQMPVPKAGRHLLAGKSLFAVNSANITVDAVKKAEHGNEIIVRIHEYHGRRGEVKVTSDYNIQSFRRVNLLEDPLGEALMEREIITYLKPYEIQTYAVTFAEQEI